MCASCAQAGGSRCYRRAADGRRGAFSSAALQSTRLRGRRVGVAASCTHALLPSPRIQLLGRRKDATRGAKLFTWNWSSLAATVVPPRRRCFDRDEMTSHVPLDLQK